jgi:hypothetical protein
VRAAGPGRATVTVTVTASDSDEARVRPRPPRRVTVNVACGSESESESLESGPAGPRRTVTIIIGYRHNHESPDDHARRVTGPAPAGVTVAVG